MPGDAGRCRGDTSPHCLQSDVSLNRSGCVECSSKEHFMHTFSRLSLTSLAVRAVAGLSLLAAAAGAQAGGVYWSVNVDAPVLPVGRVVTAVSNVPAPVVVYRSAPVVVQRPPVYYGAPVVVQQSQQVYNYGAPYQVVYQQPQVVEVVEPRRGPWPWWGHHHHHEDRDGDRGWDRWDGGGRVMVDPRDNRGGRDGDRDGGQNGRGDDGRGHRH
jgi:hypothetical protein